MDSDLKAELLSRQNIIVTCIVLVFFIFTACFYFWHSHQEQVREIEDFLRTNYHLLKGPYYEQYKQDLMDKYGLTEEDINPERTFEKYIEGQ